MGENDLHVYQNHAQGASTHCVVWDTPPRTKRGIIEITYKEYYNSVKEEGIYIALTYRECSLNVQGIRKMKISLF